MINDVQTVVRLPSALVGQIDSLAETMSKPGLRITRAAVIRLLITQGVLIEQKLVETKKPKK